MAHCNTFDHVSSSQVNESDEEDEEFYFEGVQLALKGNKDYMNLLKSLVLLEAQRKQIIEVPNYFIQDFHLLMCYFSSR